MSDIEQPALPRPFSMHWGDGEIVEEARTQSDHSVPALQLMEFQTGETAGSLALRFCHYSHAGRFQRSPLIVNESDIEAVQRAVLDNPRIRDLLLQIASGIPAEAQ